MTNNEFLDLDFLTEEVVDQLDYWLESKYRTRKICHKR